MYSFIVGKFCLQYEIKLSIPLLLLPFILTTSIDGCAVINEYSVYLLIVPGPIIETTFGFFTERCFAPTPDVAPVLIALKIFADIYANGAPVVASINDIISIDLGNPFCALSGFEP